MLPALAATTSCGWSRVPISYDSSLCEPQLQAERFHENQLTTQISNRTEIEVIKLKVVEYPYSTQFVPWLLLCQHMTVDKLQSSYNVHSSIAPRMLTLAVMGLPTIYTTKYWIWDN